MCKTKSSAPQRLNASMCFSRETITCSRRDPYGESGIPTGVNTHAPYGRGLPLKRPIKPTSPTSFFSPRDSFVSFSAKDGENVLPWIRQLMVAFMRNRSPVLVPINEQVCCLSNTRLDVFENNSAFLGPRNIRILCANLVGSLRGIL